MAGYIVLPSVAVTATVIGALVTALLACLIVKMHHRRGETKGSEINSRVKTFEEEKDAHKLDSAIYGGTEMSVIAAN